MSKGPEKPRKDEDNSSAQHTQRNSRHDEQQPPQGSDRHGAFTSDKASNSDQYDRGADQEDPYGGY